MSTPHSLIHHQSHFALLCSAKRLGRQTRVDAINGKPGPVTAQNAVERSLRRSGAAIVNHGLCRDGAVANCRYGGSPVISRIAAVLLLLALSVGAVSPAPVTSNEVRVIDGDTIRIHHQRPDVRLVGFNAPETRRANCEAERQLSGKATRRLRDLVQSSQLDFEFVACGCQPGTEGTPSCNYGRRCGTLRANGQDVGLILIRENLAVPFVCGQTRCPPTPKPWCS